MIYQKVLAAIVKERNFLFTTMKRLENGDPLTKGLLQLMQESPPQDIFMLGRCDFLIDQSNNPKIVEFNTISVSFAALSCIMQRKWGKSKRDTLKMIQHDFGLKGVPTKKCILMVVDPGERNVYDQQLLIEEGLGMPTFRKTFAELQGQLRIDEANDLWLNEYHVIIVLYRTGYKIEQYTDDAWSIRLLIERSNSKKSPSVALQLAGSKTIQSAISDLDVLKRFCPDISEEDILRLHTCFAKFYDLCDPETLSLVSSGKLGPLVLKPEREGGGNNIFGDDVPRFISTLPADQYPIYSIMEYIQSRTHKTTIIRDSQRRPDNEECVAEIGLYTTYCETLDGTEYWNHVGGLMARVKPVSSDECGVMAGLGALSVVWTCEK